MGDDAVTELFASLDPAWAGPSRPDGWNPYPGLFPFDAAWRPVFFGRDDEVRRLAATVREPAATGMVLVLGPSGCGKSSLVRAGLIPEIAADPEWHVLPPIVAGADPVEAMVAELAADGGRLGLAWTPDEVRAQLAGDGGLADVAARLLGAAAAATPVIAPRQPVDGPGPDSAGSAPASSGRRRLLVVVDQLEEILTPGDPEQLARLARLLASAMAGPVCVVATLRSEFLTPLLVDQNFAPVTAHPVRPLAISPVDGDTLRLVITEPARVAGIGVPEPLLARLVSDTGTGDRLPLLAYTLRLLAHGVPRGGVLLGHHYDPWGVAATLIRQADTASQLAQHVTGFDQDDVVAVLMELVTVADSRPAVPRYVALDELDEWNDGTRAVVQPFIDRGLLRLATVSGRASVGVVHETFLTTWPPLAAAIERAGLTMRFHREVERTAADWQLRHRPRRDLWVRGQLAAATEFLDAEAPRIGPRTPLGLRRRILTTSVDLNPTAHEFLVTSRRRDQWLRQRWWTGAFGGLVALALVAIGLAFGSADQARQLQRVATARQLVAQAERLADTDTATALQLALAAYAIDPTPETRGAVFHLLIDTHLTTTLTVPDSSENLATAMAFSPDGTIVACGLIDGTVRLWDLTGRSRATLLGSPPTGSSNRWAASSVAFSPDGHTLASGGQDGTIRLWNLSDRAHPATLGSPLTKSSPIYSVAFSPDGQTLASGGHDSTVRLWDLTDRTHPTPLGSALTGHTDTVDAVAFSPDGHTLATGSDDRTVRLWDLTDRTHATPLGSALTGHTDAVDAVAFSPDGHTLATGSDDDTVRLWDLTDRTHATPGVQPGRTHPGHRQRRRHGATVGPDRPNPPHPTGLPTHVPRAKPDSTTQPVGVHGVQPGRTPPGQLHHGRHSAALGSDRPGPGHPARIPAHRHRRRQFGGAQPRRTHPGNRRRRHHGATVGPDRPEPPHPAGLATHRPHGHRQFGDVQPGRSHPGQRQ
jgi:hypothetical protein